MCLSNDGLVNFFFYVLKEAQMESEGSNGDCGLSVNVLLRP